MAGGELADLWVSISSRFSPGGFKQAAEEGESYGARTMAVLSKVGGATVLAGAAVSAVSVKMAADWQTSMVKLSTSAGETGGLVNQRLTGNLKLVSDGLLQMSRDTATSTTELANGMYMVESAGFHGAQGLLVMKAAAEGARAEGAPLQEMANALTSALKSYHLGASSSVAVTNQMVAAVGAGKMTMSAFAGSISTVLPIAASAHISLAQVAGAMATITNHGSSAEHAAQEVAFAIRNLIAPNNVATKTMDALNKVIGAPLKGAAADAAKTLAGLGLSATDVSTNLGKRGLTGTIAMLEATVKKHEGADGLVHIWNKGKETSLTFESAMKKVMGGAVGLNAALMLGGENAKDFAKNVTTVANASKGAGKDVNGWSEITGTFNFQMGQLKQTVITYAIQLGQVLLPYVSSAIKWFTQHTAVVKVLATAIGGVLLVAVGAYIVSMTQAAIATIAATWPILAIIAAIGAIAVGLVYAYEHWTWFRNAVNAVWPAIKAGAVDFWHALQDVWDGIKGGVSDAVGAIEDVWGGLVGAWDAVVSGFDATVAWFKALPGRIMAGIEAIPGLIKAAAEQAAYNFGYNIGLIVKEAMALPGQIMDGIRAIPGLVEGLFTTMWHGTVAVFTSLWQGLVSVTSTIYHTLVSWASSAISATVAFFQAMPGRVLTFVKQLPGDIKGAVSDAGSWLISAGKAVVEGLIVGVKSMVGSAIGAVKDLGGSILSGFSAAIGHASPAKKFIPAGMAIPEGIVQGIIRSKSSAIAEVQKLGSEMVATHSKTLETLVSKTGSAAIKMGGLYDSIAAKLKTAQSSLAAIQKQAATDAANIATTIDKTGDITAATGATDAATGTTAPATAADMIANLHSSITTAQQFGQALKQLQKQGLDATSLSQLAAAGPAAGLATANALLKGGQSAITQVAQLQKQLATTATQSGTQVADAMYGSGIAAAQGLVKGLQSQEGTVLAQLTKMITAMVATVKKNLKIASPSGVFADEVGKQIPAGIAQGITSGMPAVASSLNITPGQFHLSGGPSVGSSMSGTLTLTAPIVVQLDGKTIWKSNQVQSVRYNGRNANNGQSLPVGR